jgi:ABC-2 type transport system ATP-binding protein
MLGFGTFDKLLKERNSTKHIEIRGTDFPQLKEAVRTDEGKIRIPVGSDAEVSQILYDILTRGGKVYDARQIHWDLEDLYFSFQKEVSQ